MKFPTGGKAREPRGMIRCNSEADSIVWMKEDSDKRTLGFTHSVGQMHLVYLACCYKSQFFVFILAVCLDSLSMSEL